MDLLQDYASSIYQAYTTNDPSHLPLPAQYLLSTIRTTLSPLLPLLNRLFPMLTPLTTQFQSFLETSPSVISIGVLVIALFLSIRVMGFLNRVVAYGVGVLFRLAFWGVVGLGITLVVQRGVGRTLEDVMRWGGVWWEEYRRFSEQGKKGGYGTGKSYAGGNAAGGRRNWS